MIYDFKVRVVVPPHHAREFDINSATTALLELLEDGLAAAKEKLKVSEDRDVGVDDTSEYKEAIQAINATVQSKWTVASVRRVTNDARVSWNPDTGILRVDGEEFKFRVPRAHAVTELLCKFQDMKWSKPLVLTYPDQDELQRGAKALSDAMYGVHSHIKNKRLVFKRRVNKQSCSVTVYCILGGEDDRRSDKVQDQ